VCEALLSRLKGRENARPASDAVERFVHWKVVSKDVSQKVFLKEEAKRN
jgi:hypothetical protein